MLGGINLEREKALIKKIADLYGFQEEKIKDPVRIEDSMQFTVDEIRYFGRLADTGIFELEVIGYISDKDCNLNRYLKHENIALWTKEDGKWEDTGLRFNTPQEAAEWIQTSRTEYLLKPITSCRKN